MASTLTTQSLWSKCLSGFSLTIFFASIPYFPIKKHIKPECLNIHASATVVSYLWLHKEWSWERVGLMDVIMTRWQEGGQSSDRGPITGHKLHETSFVMTLARATEQWVGRQAGMSQKTGRWRRRAMLVALLKPDLDSIAVSLFVYDLVEFDKYCISIRL